MSNKTQTPKNLKSSKNEKPPIKNYVKKNEKVHTLVEQKDGSFVIPESVAKFQRAVTVQLKEIGDCVEGLYKGMQPVQYKNGGVGALLLLQQQDDSIIGINAGYDIQRWLVESGFGDKYMGEFLRVTLDNLVPTGQAAPMKQYSFEYDSKLELNAGSNYTMKSLPFGNRFNTDGHKLLQATNELEKEVYED